MFSPLADILSLDFPSRTGLCSRHEPAHHLGNSQGNRCKPKARAHLRSRDKFLAKEAMPSFLQRGTMVTSRPSLAVAGRKQGRVAQAVHVGSSLFSCSHRAYLNPLPPPRGDWAQSTGCTALPSSVLILLGYSLEDLHLQTPKLPISPTRKP